MLESEKSVTGSNTPGLSDWLFAANGAVFSTCRTPLPSESARMQRARRGRGLRYLRHLRLSFDAPTLAPPMMKDAIDVDALLRPRPMVSCNRLLSLARLFADECDGPDHQTILYGDGLSVALLRGRGRLASPEARAAQGGRLAAWQLRRAFECIEDKLAEDVPLPVIALSISFGMCGSQKPFTDPLCG